MKLVFRGASSAALIVGLAGGFHSAWAQEGPQPQTPQTVTTSTPAPQAGAVAQVDQTSSSEEERQANDRVVVIGSLIATAPEDAPKPVEVYTAEDLKAQGQPSVSEFVRSLTVNFGSDLSFGQASQDVPTGAGFANADMRGLGPNGTLVLMNGRRLATTNGGFGADLNTVPMEALEAVEVLKDGASTTYGAGAVGGVLNFRTRRDIDAPIVTIEKSMYDGSEGELNVDFQTGWVGDAGNILLSLHYGRVEPMWQSKRDFSRQPYSVNPTQYSLNAPNPGRFHASQNFYTATVATTAAGTNVLGAVNDLPGSTGAAARTACEAVGGRIVGDLTNGPLTTSTNTACALQQFPFQDLINENDNYRFYGEVNADLLDSMEFHMDVTYSKGETIRNDIPTIAPLATMRSTDAGVGANCTSSCQFVIPVGVQTFSTAGVATGQFFRNPFIDDFMTRTGVTAAQLPATGALYTAANWRPFGYGGNPLFEDGRRETRQQRERLLIAVGLKGEFTGDTPLGRLLNGIKYDYSAQYNNYLDTNIAPDLSVARLQAALQGYGGFNCSAVDRLPTDFTSAFTFNRTIGIQSNIQPGTDGCQWFNPFASGWATSVATGAANPMFNAGNPVLPGSSPTARPTGYANPADLINWMTIDRLFETQYQSSTFDFTWSGEIPGFELPGGAIGWAAGTQWRMTERRSISGTGQPADERALNLALCPYPEQVPGDRGCSGTPGAYFGNDEHTESDEDSQTLSLYAELQLPVLDTLNMTASVRREDYNGGKITGDIYSVAGKYDITDNLFVRASYGTNFRAEAALDNDPGLVTTANEQPARFGGTATGPLFTSITTVVPDIGPEDDTTLNIGVGYQRDIGDGRFRMGVDFFEITIDGEVTTTGTATVYNNVFGQNATGQLFDPDGAGPLTPGGVSSPNQYANCAARLAFMLAFSAPCVTGVTTAASLAGVLQLTQNGPRRVLNGIDYSFDFSYPLLDGTIGASLTATQNLVYKTQGYDVAGVLFEEPQNRLGYVNQSLLVPLVPDWRANATLRWANDVHSINLRANYMSGVHDERDPALVPLGVYPSAGSLTDIDSALAGLQFSAWGVYPEDYVDFDLNYIYTAPFWEELEFRVSVLNLTDEDPLKAQNRNGYLSGIGNPRGRQIELGVTKRF